MLQPEFNPYQAPQQSPGKAEDYNLKLRIVLALLCVLPSTFGILLSITLGGLLAPTLIGRHPSGLLALLLVLMILFAWVAFFRMLWGWLVNRTVDSFWYIYGTFCGLISALVANWFSLLVLPSILLACYLVWFHSRRPEQPEPEPLGPEP